MAFFTAKNSKNPDIILSMNEQMLVLKNNANDYLVLTSKKNSFLLKIWQDNLGKITLIPWKYFYKHPNFLCDYAGCSYKIQDKTILILWKNDPTEYSCNTADLIINMSEKTFIFCPNLIPIIQKSLGQSIYWGWIKYQKLEILSTTDLFGNRPWIKNHTP